MKIVVDIPDGYIADGCFLNNIQNGSIACGLILKAVKNGKPYEERPTGHWIKDCDNCNCTNCYNSEARFARKDCSGWCSNCGELQCCTDNFCPTCGADMKGGKE